MLIKNFPVGNLMANCYIVTNEETLECVIIDPGDESNVILDYVEENKLKVKAVFLTHGHFDHVTALESVLEETGASAFICESDVSKDGELSMFKVRRFDGLRFYRDGDIIRMAGMLFGILETPGHSPGSVVIICEDAMFTGDTLFKGGCGRTDLPGGSQQDMIASLNRLAKIHGNYEVYPGHDEQTTLDAERSENTFMRSAVERRK